MKAQILKIAGVKNEKDFYKKFPTEEAFMAKHGKELKKAQKGLNEGFFGDTTSTYGYDASNADGFSKAVENAGVSSGGGGGKGFDYGSLVGPAILGAQDAQASSAYNKKLDQYLELSNLIGRIPQNKQQRPQYIRPEQQLVTGATPKGVAENGAMIGGNPTEIQNMYNIGDIYTDLEDTNPKQYQLGGQLANVNAGWNNNGVIGTKSPGWQAASNVTKNIPGLGLVVDFMGQTEANEKAGMLAQKQAPIFT
jgi:hypothetical protein